MSEKLKYKRVKAKFEISTNDGHKVIRCYPVKGAIWRYWLYECNDRLIRVGKVKLPPNFTNAGKVAEAWLNGVDAKGEVKLKP